MKKLSMIREVQRKLKSEGHKWTQKDIEHYIYEELENGGPDKYETRFDQSDCDYFASHAIAVAEREAEMDDYSFATDDVEWDDEVIYEPEHGQPA